ncbi:MAG TPA: rhomboid family intramembrane serine protease [Tenuifilaceae bacterium]|nr:rhomboid family intramembrane serine protease [Tenuifilaceae bacterium]HNV80872.1 rhomboid family intramembrane serine protease [Tenuifilaceae bacterium]
MNYSRISFFQNTPTVVKNLIIINVIMLLATYVLGNMGVDLNRTLGLYFFQSPHFRPFQLVSHMFMHGGIAHLFFNMFALYMFGRVLEQVWGGKRFFVYYFFTGIGAALLHNFVNYLEAQAIMSNLTPEQIAVVKSEGTAVFLKGQNYSHQAMGALNLIMNIPTVGASGAVFGVLLAFGMYFPNTVLMLIFPPIPIKAKYFVMIYGGIELWLGITQANSNIAHFAHLGGMLFGFILIRLWRKSRHKFY